MTTPAHDDVHIRPYAMAILFVASVVAANVATNVVGLVTIGPLMVTAGTFVVGATFTVRDAVPARLMPVVLAVSAVGSWALASPRLAVASAATFLVSESVDWAVFARLVRRGRSVAVVVSGFVGALVDSAMFLHLAGFPVTWSTVAGQVAVKTSVAAAVLTFWRRR